MAYEQQGFKIGTEVAAADLSSNQYYCVELSSTGWVLTGDGEAVDGVLQDKPESGQSAEVMIDGVSKCVSAAAIAKGANVSSAASGKVETSATGNYILGRALEASGGDGEVIAVALTKPGRLA